MRTHVVAAVFLAVFLVSVVALGAQMHTSLPTGSSVVSTPQEFWPGLILGMLAIFVVAFFVIRPTEQIKKKK